MIRFVILRKDSLYRNYHHDDLTFGLIYAFSERFVLVFSHDEVVHGKRALLSKMPGDMWQQFCQFTFAFKLYDLPARKKTDVYGWRNWAME